MESSNQSELSLSREHLEQSTNQIGKPSKQKNKIKIKQTKEHREEQPNRKIKGEAINHKNQKGRETINQRRINRESMNL